MKSQSQDAPPGDVREHRNDNLPPTVNAKATMTSSDDDDDDQTTADADDAGTGLILSRMESKKVRRRHRRTSRLQHLTSCDARTVENLTGEHFRLLADSMKAHSCWNSRVARLEDKLEESERAAARQRQQQPSSPVSSSSVDGEEVDDVDAGGTPAPTRGPSANQGYRIRCRFLLKFDTCRRNFLARYGQLDPEVEFSWPLPVWNAMNHDDTM